MATTALRSLRDLLRPAFTNGQRDRKEVFGLLVRAARELVGARPAMSAAISAVLLRAIDTLAKEWRIDATESDSAPRTLEESDFKQAQQIFTTLLAEREASIKVLGRTFATHIFTTYFRPAESKHTPFRLLTLSDSSTISHALSELCTLYVDSRDSGDLPDGIAAPIYRRPIHISILESRPRCEGADLAARLFRHARSKSPVHLPEAKDEMLKITIFPDCAVAAAARDADVLLLGADRIGANGDLRNKIGSLAAVCAVKVLNAKARVMVVSDVDKISSGESGGVGDWHGPGELMGGWSEGAREGLGWDGSEEEKKEMGKENGEGGCNEEVQKQVRAEVYGEWFETVPADLCEMEYITDRGVLKREEIAGLGKEVAAWKEKYFGDS